MTRFVRPIIAAPLCLLLLAHCATPPATVAPPAVPTPPATAAPAMVQVAALATAQAAPPAAPQSPAPACECACPAAPVCPAPAATPPAILATPTPPATPPVIETRGRLERVSFTPLPDWKDDDHKAALDAFLQGCPMLRAQTPWERVCDMAAAMAARAKPRDAQRFFEQHFEPWQVVNPDETRDGLFTGYYEPLLNGSRVRTERYRYPVYAPPTDLLTIDLSEVYPELKHRRLRGRIVGNKVVPYLARSDIDGDQVPLKGLELAWVDDPVELFFLQIQGSGQIRFEDGTSMRVGYADQNGHPFRSLGGALIRAREIRAEQASMQGIKAWAKANPAKLQSFFNMNPSVVFFKELPADLSGPIGTLGVPLTGERSIAVDPRVVPLGPPVFVSTTFPATSKPLNRLMVAQDTGGAIAGGVRVDFFWGFGDEAGQTAGRMKQRGKMWVLLPKGYAPEQFSTPVLK